MWPSLCFLPVLLLGYGVTYEKSSRSTDLSSLAVEARTCDEGVALYGRAQVSGLYAGGITYGFLARRGHWFARAA